MASLADKPTLLLFDGNNLFYRSFFAIPPLATRAGFPTNAVLGFTNVLRKVLTDEPHDFAAVTFDAGGRTFRHVKFQAYKANRPPTPDSLKQQTPYTRRLCAALGLRILETPGIEADDLIGTLARRGVEDGHRVLIVSSDKDLLQLVSEDVTVIHPVKYERLDPEVSSRIQAHRLCAQSRTRRRRRRAHGPPRVSSSSAHPHPRPQQTSRPILRSLRQSRSFGEALSPRLRERRAPRG